MARLLCRPVARPLRLPPCVRGDMKRTGSELRVITHGGLQCHGQEGPTDDTITLDAGTTLEEALASLGIDRGLVGVAALDGRIVQLDAVLQSDGVIHVYPIFGGG